MNELKTIANEIMPVYENEMGDKLVNARELHEQLFVGRDFTTWIKQRINNYGFFENEDYYLTLTKTGERKNVTKHEYLLFLDTAKEIAMVENNEQGRAIRKYFIKVEKQSREQRPQSQAQMLLMYAEQFVKQEQDIKQIKSDNETIKHRLDNIDSLDTIGDLQQRLNGMVRRYAQQEGMAFGSAWRDFRQTFNTAYRTNLKSKMNHYKEKHGLKSLTMPQYLSLTDNLEDAIRVADKMLNREVVQV